jgi:hypothetical protein
MDWDRVTGNWKPLSGRFGFWWSSRTNYGSEGGKTGLANFQGSGANSQRGDEAPTPWRRSDAEHTHTNSLHMSS